MALNEINILDFADESIAYNFRLHCAIRSYFLHYDLNGNLEILSMRIEKKRLRILCRSVLVTNFTTWVPHYLSVVSINFGDDSLQ